MALTVDELRKMSGSELLYVADGYTSFCYMEEMNLYDAHRKDVAKAIELNKTAMIDIIASAERCGQHEDSVQTVVYGAIRVIKDNKREEMLSDIAMPATFAIAKQIKENIHDFYFVEHDLEIMEHNLREMLHIFGGGFSWFYGVNCDAIDTMKIAGFMVEAAQQGNIMSIKQVDRDVIVFESQMTFIEYGKVNYRTVSSLSVKNIYEEQ